MIMKEASAMPGKNHPLRIHALKRQLSHSPTSRQPSPRLMECLALLIRETAGVVSTARR